MANDSANDRQPGGEHYKKHGNAVQHWDFVAEAGLGYHDGNATKYVDRFRDKAGRLDLEKAGHYLQKCKELGLTPPPLSQAMAAFNRYTVYRPDIKGLQLEALGCIVTGDYDGAMAAVADLTGLEYGEA